MFRNLMCKLGWHHYQECRPNHICIKTVKKCKHCFETYCKIENIWIKCDSNNECDWSFSCGFKDSMKNLEKGVQH